eukprot:CAMPEP_0181108218 /NCGR_PEP_ID=MMETSP1071-20121207/17513_1 /TAXON_ID=35127 /ORGANISM="Thalassiosira sp., Strain NH16" /LENGTH=237 /DNA_ID=CAMNT_0023191807 /DNA_START=28 /DNA_END=741 /DNA_ORIENTATION=-
MSNSVASSQVGGNRKYNIAPEFLSSPYLSKPIGSFDHDKRRSGGSPRESSRRAKPTRRRRGDNDAESVTSFRTQRSVSTYRTQQSLRRPSQNSARRNVSMKNFLLPREMEKLLRGFRQKHSNHPMLRGRSGGGDIDDEDDNSTIASDFAESLDDKAVYLNCRKDQNVIDSLFSGPLFAEISLRNAGRGMSDGPVLTLPPVGTIDHDKNGASGDVSDLESVPSASKLLIDHKHPRRKR